MFRNPLFSNALCCALLLGSLAATHSAPLANTRKGLEQEFGERFRVEDTHHWLLVTDLDPKRAAQIGRLLERTHARFYKDWAKLGAEPLSHRLVCIAFSSREELDRYRARMGRATPGDAGFYSSDTNRIVLCEEDRESGQGGQATAFGAGGAKRHHRTAHEAAHQLAFNSGLQLRDRACPAWFAEGLASNYEPASASAPFGLDADFPPDRLRALRALQADGALLPLEKLVTVRPGAESHRHRVALYPQAAALCRFLYARSPDGFAAYRAQLAKIRLKYPSQSSLRRAFEEAFGSTDAMRDEWQTFLASPEARPGGKKPAQPTKRRNAAGSRPW